MRKYVALLILLAFSATAFADGGRLRMRRKAGPFVVTLFTTPDPLTQGRADFSVAVERASGGGLVQDANVTFILTPMTGHQDPIVLHATRGAATSRFLQAANFDLPHPGNWQITIVIEKGAERGQCFGTMEVLPPRFLGNEFAWDIAAVPLVLILFLVHQWRKRKYLRSRATQFAEQQESRLVVISNAAGTREYGRSCN